MPLHDVALLAFTLAAAVHWVALAASFHTLSDNDGAYYFGLARRIATTGRFEEPIVWHFLTSPERIVHAPFDYWAPMPVFALVVPMAVFGATNAVAAVTIALVGTATLVAFWYLVCVSMPFRHPITRFLAIVLFALSPGTASWRLQPESIVFVHLFILLALIAYCAGRHALSVLLAAGIFLSRTDGVFLFGVFVLANVHATYRLGLRQTARPLAAAAGFAAVYIAWSFVSFGTPTPPAPSKLPFLLSYWQVFNWGIQVDRSPQFVLAKLDWAYFVARIEQGYQAIRSGGFVAVQDVWLLFAVLSVVPILRGGRRGVALAWMLFFVGFTVHVWLSGESFASWRAPYGYLPLIVIAGALGVEEVLNHVGAWPTHERQRALGLLGTSVVFAAFITNIAARARLPVPLDDSRTAQVDFMRQVEPLVGGRPVASNASWWVLAYTTSPVVSIPINGEAAIDAVLEKYGVEYVVLWGKPPVDLASPSQDALQGARTSGHGQVGRFELERVKDLGAGEVFRVLKSDQKT